MVKEVKYFLALNLTIYILVISFVGLNVLRLSNLWFNIIGFLGIFMIGYLLLALLFFRKPQINPAFAVVKRDLFLHDHIRLLGLVFITFGFYYASNLLLSVIFFAVAFVMFLLHTRILFNVNQKIKSSYNGAISDYAFADKNVQELIKYASKLKRKRYFALVLAMISVIVFTWTNFVHEPTPPFYFRVVRLLIGYTLFYKYLDIVYAEIKYHFSTQKIMIFFALSVSFLFISVIVYNLTGAHWSALMIAVLGVIMIQSLFHVTPHRVEYLARMLEQNMRGI